MRVLVIGGTEFISLHLVQALLRDRHEVAMLNRGRHPERAPKDARTIVCDRKDWTALKTALAAERFDGLVDITYAPTTGEDVEALLAALGGRVGHAIFVSTGRVHDHAQPMPLAEDAPRNLYWGDYARLKIAGEDAYMRSGVPATIVRPTHVYGPLNTRNNETFFFDRLLRGRPILVPGHGGWLRQFGHVEDLADAMAAMLGDRRVFGQAYNVTGEEVVTQIGFVDLIADVVKRPARLVYVARAA
jgi:nucleoside-diphosphate-sugar epimerase